MPCTSAKKWAGWVIHPLKARRYAVRWKRARELNSYCLPYESWPLPKGAQQTWWG